MNTLNELRFKCRSCPDSFKYEQKTTHDTKLCKKNKFYCPTGCGLGQITDFSILEHHLNYECKNSPMICLQCEVV